MWLYTSIVDEHSTMSCDLATFMHTNSTQFCTNHVLCWYNLNMFELTGLPFEALSVSADYCPHI